MPYQSPDVEFDAGQRLLVAEQQRFVAGVEIGGAQLGMAFQIEPAGLHEGERLGNPVGELDISLRLLPVGDGFQHPLVDATEARIAAMGEGAQQIEGGGRPAVGLDLPAGIGPAGGFRELDVVDDVAAIARQLLAVALLHRRGARLGELAGDAADLHHRRGGPVGQHHRHLQEDAEEIADVVGAVLGKAFGAVAALEQESLALGDAAERFLEVARLSGEEQRRQARELRLDGGDFAGIRVFGQLGNRLIPPAGGHPTLGHDQTPPARHDRLRVAGLIHEAGRTRPEGARPVGAQPSDGPPTRPPGGGDGRWAGAW